MPATCAALLSAPMAACAMNSGLRLTTPTASRVIHSETCRTGGRGSGTDSLALGVGTGNGWVLPEGHYAGVWGYQSEKTMGVRVVQVRVRARVTKLVEPVLVL